MSENLSICCSGSFPFVPVLDVALSERSRISTLNGRSGIGCEWNFSIVRVPFSDSSRRVIAVGASGCPPHSVLVYDVNTRQLISNCVGSPDQIFGLASLSSETLSANPLIAAGTYPGDQILLFDALNGSTLGNLEVPEEGFTLRLMGVPEWSRMDLFVAGKKYTGGFVGRYDLTTNRKIGEYEGHSKQVYGLCPIISRELLVSSDSWSTVRIWSRDDYTCQTRISLELSSAYSCCCDEDTNLFVLGLKDGTVEVRDIRVPEERLRTIKVSDQLVGDIARIDENRFVSASGDGAVTIFNAETEQVVCNTTLPEKVSGVCLLRG